MIIIKKRIKSELYAALLMSSLFTGGVVVQSVWAADFEVPQEGKQFSVKQLKIKIGDTVHFPNDDPFFHNVYSLSPAKTFDLGSYPEGETRSVTFDRAGHVDIECAIHPRMHMTIEISGN